jgi:hypothetical protein
MVSFCSGKGVRSRCVNSSPCIGEMLMVGFSSAPPPTIGTSSRPRSPVSAGPTPAVMLNLYVAAMLEMAVKCIGWFWRARAMLRSNCFDTLSAVVVS